MKMESAGKDMRRIVSDTGKVVGLAAKLMNNRWCALDCDGGRISRAGFSTLRDKSCSGLRKRSGDGGLQRKNGSPLH